MILLRYFFREVLVSTVAVSLVLLLVTLSTRFVKYLASAAAGDLDANVLIWLVLYRIPDFLQLILPLGLFVALLLTYGRLYLDNEMRVLFAAGISRVHLLGLTLVPVFFLALVVGLISFWISPYSLAKVDALLEAQSARSELDVLKEGRFQPFRRNEGVIYAEKITDKAAPDSGVLMQDVYIFQQEATVVNGARRFNEVMLVSKSGAELFDQRGRYLILEEGYRIRELKNEESFERVDFGRYGQRIDTREKIELSNLKADALSSVTLLASDHSEHQAVLQWRISLALLVPIVALIAVAMGKADPRQGRYLKILPAILIYLVYLVLLNMARDKLAQGEWPLAIGMWWVHALFLGLGVLLFNMESIRRWATHSVRGVNA